MPSLPVVSSPDFVWCPPPARLRALAARPRVLPRARAVRIKWGSRTVGDPAAACSPPPGVGEVVGRTAAVAGRLIDQLAASARRITRRERRKQRLPPNPDPILSAPLEVPLGRSLR